MAIISPSEIKVGIVAEQGLDIWSALTCLKQNGCIEENIVVKYVPPFQLALGALFFAEYTDVDCTLVIAREYNSAIASSLLDLQIQWNMPIDYTIAPVLDCDAVVRMVQLQSQMAREAEALTDRKSVLS
jgi:6,7-dimethyl-8-ribityllumazine synthase